MDTVTTMLNLPSDLLIHLTLFLSPASLPGLLASCSLLLATLDGSNYLFKTLALRSWASKVYLPSIFTIRLDGPTSIRAWEASQKAEIMAAHSIKQLRIALLQEKASTVEISGCYEKQELASLLVSKRLQVLASVAGHGYTPAPRLSEVPAKEAFRVATHDFKRGEITPDDLKNLTFYVRVRKDGPLAQLMPVDPWWLGKGETVKVTFSADNMLSWTFPVDEATGEVMNPFAYVVDPLAMENMKWQLDVDGVRQAVRIVVGGQPGPLERVFRHPKNGGWILYSSATIWTSWETTADGNYCNDSYAAEEYVSQHLY